MVRERTPESLAYDTIEHRNQRDGNKIHSVKRIWKGPNGRCEFMHRIPLALLEREGEGAPQSEGAPKSKPGETAGLAQVRDRFSNITRLSTIEAILLQELAAFQTIQSQKIEPAHERYSLETQVKLQPLETYVMEDTADRYVLQTTFLATLPSVEPGTKMRNHMNTQSLQNRVS